MDLVKPAAEKRLTWTSDSRYHGGDPFARQRGAMGLLVFHGRQPNTRGHDGWPSKPNSRSFKKRKRPAAGLAAGRQRKQMRWSWCAVISISPATTHIAEEKRTDSILVGQVVTGDLNLCKPDNMVKGVVSLRGG
jgi:hypothetical protein